MAAPRAATEALASAARTTRKIPLVTQRNIAALRERLDPETLAARWAEGRALDWEQAVELALG